MNRYLCIHGHFYQPPRENPWLEAVEFQDSAYPYHDWNQRITAECYAPNAASRILEYGRITRIVNNYANMSFNFGPTLSGWLERKEPEVLEEVIIADRESAEKFGGHGSALAQVYNHMIMPLANAADKRTQVTWGKAHFRRVFGRDPEGIWLPETAVDRDTLEALVDAGISFTILAPSQARRVRRTGARNWQDVSNSRIDPKIAYSCHLPSGRRIALFFYDGPISQEIGFGKLLENGEAFADRLMSGFDGREDVQLMHIATDGETYGHHRPHGDMALAYCLHLIETRKLARLTNYGQFLEMFPPTHEVEIFDNSSWSCVHGVERWRSDCGCSTGMRGGWHQKWRAPLRTAMDWLRDALILIFNDRAEGLLSDPWAAREAYLAVIEDRSPENVDRFLEAHTQGELSDEDRVRALRLLEMQRHAMLMYTSCGWFFDEISGMENVQVLTYAARAMQLAREVSGIDLEPGYLAILERAPSNIPELGNGAQAFLRYVQPQVLDLQRVAAHYALASLFLEVHPDQSKQIYCYTVDTGDYRRSEMGRQILATGTGRIRSDITYESGQVNFTVVHLGDPNFIGGVRRNGNNGDAAAVHDRIREAFLRSDITQVIALMDGYYGNHNYSLWSLFKDEQRKILGIIMESTLKTVEFVFRQVYNTNLPVIRAISESGIPLPRAFSATVDMIVNTDLRSALEAEEPRSDRLRELTEMAQRWQVQLDREMLGYLVSDRANGLVKDYLANLDRPTPLLTLRDIILGTAELHLPLHLWKAQNMYYHLAQQAFPEGWDQAPIEQRERFQLLHELGSWLK